MKLVQKEKEQKSFDEFINKVLEIYGIKKHILTTKTGVFVDRRSKKVILSTKKAISVDTGILP